jgi:SAM-dependent methyltransferase
MTSSESFFERQIAEASRQPFSGWDFSYLNGRMLEDRPAWDYAERVRRRFPGASALLDLGTGGGEVLAGLAPPPPRTTATEGYPPNVAVARARLAPLGVEVVAVEGAPDNLEIAPGAGIGSLPFPDSSFPLAINRHESYYPAEVYRVLAPGGVFITQQVGGTHHRALNRLLGAPETSGMAWNLAFAVDQLAGASFRVIDQREEFPETVFRDIGAVVYYLKAAPWQVPDFTVERYHDRLAALHERIEAEGSLRVSGHLFYLEAVKPLA